MNNVINFYRTTEELGGGVQNVTIKNTIIKASANFRTTGIHFNVMPNLNVPSVASEHANITIENNHMYDLGSAIEVYKTSGDNFINGITIKNNKIGDENLIPSLSRHGIYLSNVFPNGTATPDTLLKITGNEIFNITTDPNKFFERLSAIYISFGMQIDISNNIIHDITCSVENGATGIYTDMARKIYIKNNEISKINSKFGYYSSYGMTGGILCNSFADSMFITSNSVVMNGSINGIFNNGSTKYNATCFGFNGYNVYNFTNFFVVDNLFMNSMVGDPEVFFASATYGIDKVIFMPNGLDYNDYYAPYLLSFEDNNKQRSLACPLCKLIPELMKIQCQWSHF